jgi:uncharacterized protein YwqG
VLRRSTPQQDRDTTETQPRWDAPPATVQEFRERLDAVGLSEHAEALTELARDSIRLMPDLTADLTEPGTTRLGGEPDLPVDTAWPDLDGRPLSFIAQINLAGLPPAPASTALPNRGLLSFFYDAATQSAWGFDPADRGSWAVRYSPDEQPWTPRPAPDALPLEGRFTALGLTGSSQLCFPPWESHDVEQLGIDSPWSTYASVLGDQDETLHRLLGHPDPLQGDMQQECQLASNGINCGGPEHLSDPRTPSLLPGASEWRLLLQIDSTETDTGMMWGDVGRLYYWIREEDLRARAWDLTWLVLRCG